MMESSFPLADKKLEISGMAFIYGQTNTNTVFLKIGIVKMHILNEYAYFIHNFIL